MNQFEKIAAVALVAAGLHGTSLWTEQKDTQCFLHYREDGVRGMKNMPCDRVDKILSQHKIVFPRTTEKMGVHTTTYLDWRMKPLVTKTTAPSKQH